MINSYFVSKKHSNLNLILILSVTSLLILSGCTKKGNLITGSTIAFENEIEIGNMNEKTNQTNTNKEISGFSNLSEGDNNITDKNITETNQLSKEKEPQDFTFSSSSVVNSQRGIFISIDDVKYEIKEDWGKITGIETTVLNKGDGSFKPKIVVLLYDEGDSMEEWLKPKAQVEFDDELNPGGHITKQVIVNLAFNDLNLTKNLKLILTDGSIETHKALVVVEKKFRFG